MQYDVTIIGGGPAGAAASIYLARAGRKVVLIYKDELRTVLGETLIPSGKILLSELECWEGFEEEHLPAFGNASSWGSNEIHYTDFIRSPHGNAWHLDKKAMDERLLKKAKELGVNVIAGAHFQSANRTDSGWLVEYLQKNTTHLLRSNWVMDASGRKSVFTQHLNIKRECQDKLMAAIVLLNPIITTKDVDSLSRIESAEKGWWYTTRLIGGKRLLAFFIDARLPWFKSIRKIPFLQNELENTFHLKQHIIENYSWPDKVRLVDASTTFLINSYGENWLALGDAAQSFDPLSSQGVYHALYSGKIAAEAYLNNDKGDSDAMTRYDHQLKSIYQKFEINRKQFYQSELRWKESPFWQREHNLVYA